jgi:hypothetical protein
MSNNYLFDRPVIILATPRSGSTLLFETLSATLDFWTIGGESHGLIESIPRFNPLNSQCDSNALSAEDATPAIVQQIRVWFYQQLRDARGRPIRLAPNAGMIRPRFLEKTPKNALRVSLLNRIFPDALFIYLYRNPRENISSMMEAWESKRFVTYPSLPGREKGWSLLLPSGWQDYNEASLEETAAFQWKAASLSILNELEKIGPERWITVSYDQQVNALSETVQRISEFCDVPPLLDVSRISGDQARLSKYTLTPPKADKWLKNVEAIRRVLPGLQDTMAVIRQQAAGLTPNDLDMTLPPPLSETPATGNVPVATATQEKRPSRSKNSPCYCGSKKKYKHCHGKPTPLGAER